MTERGVPAGLPDLPRGEVQVHHLDLTAPAPPFVVEAHLSAEERRRAGDYLSPSARAHFVTVRCALRVLLARHLRVAPAQVPLTAGPHGKPAVAGGAGRLTFSVTHTDGLALLAVTRGRAVGVDAERVRPHADLRAVADRFFTPRERAALAAWPDAQAFYRVWTRREAALKATGAGLAGRVEVDASAAPCGWLISVEGGAASGWRSLDLSAPPGVQAALVVRGGAGLHVRDVPAHAWR